MAGCSSAKRKSVPLRLSHIPDLRTVLLETHRARPEFPGVRYHECRSTDRNSVRQMRHPCCSFKELSLHMFLLLNDLYWCRYRRTSQRHPSLPQYQRTLSSLVPAFSKAAPVLSPASSRNKCRCPWLPSEAFVRAPDVCVVSISLDLSCHLAPCGHSE